MNTRNKRKFLRPEILQAGAKCITEMACFDVVDEMHLLAEASERDLENVQFDEYLAASLLAEFTGNGPSSLCSETRATIVGAFLLSRGYTKEHQERFCHTLLAGS